ncbi:MAG: DNA-deoxyinosine glycosylase [Erysipelotrichaceae bacterium]|nr:DNA-deoxyinosine glycosylase [Erysipelotrichaceae bacterium]
MEYLSHPFKPVYDKNSEVLILGSFPSVKSRENDFYYGNKNNRFFKLLSELFNEELPLSNDEKKDFLLRHKIAVYDVIKSCHIKGSSDASISDVIPTDLKEIIDNSNIKRIYANGKKAYELYNLYQKETTGMDITLLPSTSPANAAFSLDKLKRSWSSIFDD